MQIFTADSYCSTNDLQNLIEMIINNIIFELIYQLLLYEVNEKAVELIILLLKVKPSGCLKINEPIYALEKSLHSF